LATHIAVAATLIVVYNVALTMMRLKMMQVMDDEHARGSIDDVWLSYLYCGTREPERRESS